MPDKEEIQVRQNFWHKDTIHEGITIQGLGEQYGDNSPLRTSDVDYPCAVTLVQREDGDAVQDNDTIDQWAKEIRQRFMDQRIGVGDIENVKEHVCRVTPGSPSYPVKQFPEYRVRQLIVHVWARELNYVS